jgi:acylphosphatase
MVDFYPKPTHAKKNLADVSVRVVAESDTDAKKQAKSEFQSGYPDLNLTEFEIEVSELLYR